MIEWHSRYCATKTGWMLERYVRTSGRPRTISRPERRDLAGYELACWVVSPRTISRPDWKGRGALVNTRHHPLSQRCPRPRSLRSGREVGLRQGPHHSSRRCAHMMSTEPTQFRINVRNRTTPPANPTLNLRSKTRPGRPNKNIQGPAGARLSSCRAEKTQNRHQIPACAQRNGTKTAPAASLHITATNQHQASRNTQLYRVQGLATDTCPIKKNSEGHQS